MRKSIILFLFFNSFLLNGQNVFVVGNVQVNNMLDESTFPTMIDFQFSTRLSIGMQFPLYFDSIQQIEKASIEIGLGTLFNSLYHKNPYRSKPKSDASMNDVFGLFLKLEPYYNLWQNKKKTLFFHASLNNIAYIFGDYSVETSFLKKDSSEVKLLTKNAKFKYQYVPETYLGVTYILKTKTGNRYLFRLKSGYAFHNLPIAKMSLTDSNELSSIKLNNFNFQFSIGLLSSSKE